jgi:hypothetical protein
MPSATSNETRPQPTRGSPTGCCDGPQAAARCVPRARLLCDSTTPPACAPANAPTGTCSVPSNTHSPAHTTHNFLDAHSTPAQNLPALQLAPSPASTPRRPRALQAGAGCARSCVGRSSCHTNTLEQTHAATQHGACTHARVLLLCSSRPAGTQGCTRPGRRATSHSTRRPHLRCRHMHAQLRPRRPAPRTRTRTRTRTSATRASPPGSRRQHKRTHAAARDTAPAAWLP